MVNGNSYVQISTEPAVRGRVMALWAMAMMGLTPFVAPLIGLVGDTFGASATIWFGVIPVTICFLGVSWYLFVRRGLRVYLDSHRHFQVHAKTHDDAQQYR